MKKTLIAMAVLGAASGFAMAESQVTLYGNIDGGVTVSKSKGYDTTTQMSNGNWASNSFGIRGTEDLGNGNSVFFRLEQGFKIDSGEIANGPDNGAFNRQATLGVAGNWGQFAFGRFGGLTSDTGTYSILGGSAYGTNFQPVGSLAGAFVIAPRANNAVVYASPEFAGLNLYAAYSNGVDTDDNKFSQNAHYYGLGATYNVGAFNSNLSWEMYDNKNQQGAARKSSNVVTLGASYDFGVVTLYGAYQYANNIAAYLFPTNGDYVSVLYKTQKNAAGEDVPVDFKGADQNAFSLSLSAPLGGGTAYLQSQFAFGKLHSKDQFKDANMSDKYNMWSIGAAYTYPLSKRTLVYGGAAYGDAGKAFKSANAKAMQFRSWNATVGVSHSF